jgi:L-ascorbate metabolism protein UlaG (beta-lactamase superfamily)
MGELYRVRYLGHSAWMLETKRYCLFFDCQDENVREGGLAEDGFVDLKQIADKSVYLFFSHSHHDHYSPKLHRAGAGYDNVRTVLGDFTVGGAAPANTISLTALPREPREAGDLTVHTAGSTDAGLCFLIQADGLGIFFAGDNADWDEGAECTRFYRQEIDYLAGLNIKTDIAFIPVCTFSGQRPKPMTEGAFYAIDQLKPCLTFPMHANGRERLYEAFQKDLRASGRDALIVCADKPGFYFDK